MPPALPFFARRTDGRVVFRDGPTPLALTLSGLRSADGHDVTAFVTAAVRPVDRPADVELFVEYFLTGRDNVTDEDVRRHFVAALSPSATAHVASRDTAATLADVATFEALVRGRLVAIAFGCGLDVLPTPSVTLDSESWRHDRQQEQSRARHLAEAAHAAELATRLAAAGPAHRLAATDQSALLPTLHASVARTPLLATAGPNLLLMRPDEALRTIVMPAEIGALRCVRAVDASTYAVGGTGGVALLGAELNVTRVLTGGSTSGRGFNAVGRVEATGEVVATHGEIGLAVWPNDGRARLLATPQPARGLLVSGARVFIAADGTACVYENDAIRPICNGATIVALLAVGADVLVVRHDGSFDSVDPVTLRVDSAGRVAGPVTAAALLELPGLPAVLVADDRGRIDAVTPQGRLLGRIAVRPDARMLAAAGGAVVAVSGDRASVLVWAAGEGGQAPESTNVLARTGHHVTDVIGTTTFV